MTVIGVELEAAGFEVRVPELSRRKPTPSLRLFTEIDRRFRRRRPPAQQRALVGPVRRRRADRGGRRPARRRGPSARALARPLGRARPGRPQGGGRRACRAGDEDPAHGGRDPPLRHRPRRLTARRRDRASRAAAGRPICSSGRRTCPTEPITRPPGFDGELRSYQAEALAWLGFLDAAELGGCLALDMGLGKTPTVLAHLARTTGERSVARRRTPGRRRQLGRRSSPVHAEPPGRRAPRRLAGHGRRARGRGGRRRRRHHDLRHRGPRRRGAGRADVGPDRARRGAGDQEPGERDGAAAAPHPRPHAARAHRHADRERPRRPVVDPRLHQPGPRRHPARVHRPDGRRGRGGAAGAQRHPRVPPHQERARSWPPSCPTASTSSTTAR